MNRTQAIAAIKSARLKAGITQAAAAQAAGISQPVWHHVEAGERSVAPDTIVRMAAAVGLRLRHVPESFALPRTRGTAGS